MSVASVDDLHARPEHDEMLCVSGDRLQPTIDVTSVDVVLHDAGEAGGRVLGRCDSGEPVAKVQETPGLLCVRITDMNPSPHHPSVELPSS
jgi:hypothetical protein